jgi:hypothetical protein
VAATKRIAVLTRHQRLFFRLVRRRFFGNVRAWHVDRQYYMLDWSCWPRSRTWLTKERAREITISCSKFKVQGNRGRSTGSKYDSYHVICYRQPDFLHPSRTLRELTWSWGWLLGLFISIDDDDNTGKVIVKDEDRHITLYLSCQTSSKLSIRCFKMASTQQIHDLYDSVLILDFGSQVRPAHTHIPYICFKPRS